jgi:hypothetical protein
MIHATAVKTPQGPQPADTEAVHLYLHGQEFHLNLAEAAALVANVRNAVEEWVTR